MVQNAIECGYPIGVQFKHPRSHHIIHIHPPTWITLAIWLGKPLILTSLRAIVGSTSFPAMEQQERTSQSWVVHDGHVIMSAFEAPRGCLSGLPGKCFCFVGVVEEWTRNRWHQCLPRAFDHLLPWPHGRVRDQGSGDTVTVMQMATNADVLTMLLLYHVVPCCILLCLMWSFNFSKTFEDLVLNWYCLCSGQVAISQLWLPGESLLCWICCFVCSVRSFGRGREEAKLMQDWAGTSWNTISMGIPIHTEKSWNNEIVY